MQLHLAARSDLVPWRLFYCVMHFSWWWKSRNQRNKRNQPLKTTRTHTHLRIVMILRAGWHRAAVIVSASSESGSRTGRPGNATDGVRRPEASVPTQQRSKHAPALRLIGTSWCKRRGPGKHLGGICFYISCTSRDWRGVTTSYKHTRDIEFN